jgi:hypothetical protein
MSCRAPARPIFLTLAVLAVASVAAGCSSVELIPQSPAASEQLAASPAQPVLQVALAPVKGAPAPVSQAVVRSLNEAALQNGIALIIDPSVEVPTRLEGALSADRNQKGVKLAFEWNVLGAGNAPLRRIAGAEQLPPAPSIDVWATTTPAIIDAMTRKVVSELRVTLTAPSPASTAVVPTTAAATAPGPAKAAPARIDGTSPPRSRAAPAVAAASLPASGEARSMKEGVRDLVVDGRAVGAIPVSFGAGGEVRVPKAALIDMLLPSFGDDPDRLARIQGGATDDLSVKELRDLGFSIRADPKRITIGKASARGDASARGPTSHIAGDDRR